MNRIKDLLIQGKIEHFSELETLVHDEMLMQNLDPNKLEDIEKFWKEKLREDD